MINQNDCSIIYFKNRRTGHLFHLPFSNNLTINDIKILLSNNGYYNPLLLIKKHNGYADACNITIQSLSNISVQEPIQVAYTLE